MGAVWREPRPHCIIDVMMSKRVIAIVLVLLLVLAGGSWFFSLFG